MRVSPLIPRLIAFWLAVVVCPAQAVLEREYNDNSGYANDLGDLSAPRVVAGYVNALGDADTFRFEARADGVLRIRTTYNGREPEAVITNVSGDENWGLHRFAAGRLTLPIPKGVYHVRLGGVAVVTKYSMRLELQAQSIPSLVLGQTTQLPVGPDYACLRVVQPQDGRLRLGFTTTNQADAFLVLQNAQWGYVYEVDDANPSTLEPGLDAVLPKGTYYLYIGADIAAQTSIRATSANLVIHELKSNANGSVTSQGESFELHKLVLTAVEKVHLAISRWGSTGITDSYLQLFDRNMVQILESDDDSASTLSSVGVTLPPGVYYVASTGYCDRGDYLLTRTSAAGALVPVRAGSNSVTSGADDATTMRFVLETPAGVEFNAIGGPGYDPQVCVLDAKTGLSLGWEDDDSLGPHGCNLGMRLPAGEYLVIAKSYDGAAGVFEVEVIPPLQRWALEHVRVRAHDGQLAYFLVSHKLAGPSNPLPGILSGNLLVDLSASLSFVATIPWDGLIDFQTPLMPGSGVFLQMVTIDLASSRGRYSNLLK